MDTEIKNSNEQQSSTDRSSFIVYALIALVIVIVIAIVVFIVKNFSVLELLLYTLMAIILFFAASCITSRFVPEHEVALRTDGEKILTDRVYSGENVNTCYSLITFPRQRQVYSLNNIKVVTEKKTIEANGESMICDEVELTVNLNMYYYFPTNDPVKLKNIYIQFPPKISLEGKRICDYAIGDFAKLFAENATKDVLGKYSWKECMRGVCYVKDEKVSLNKLLNDRFSGPDNPLIIHQMVDTMTIEITNVNLSGKFSQPR